jgi:hypothetical protein
MAQPVKFIPCDIDNCRLPVGEIINSTITITSRHHGKRHQKTITLAELLQLIREQSDTKLLTLETDSCSTPAVKT